MLQAVTSSQVFIRGAVMAKLGVNRHNKMLNPGVSSTDKGATCRFPRLLLSADNC
jgi:hypothetical protein